MSRNPHDQFAKQFLEELLSPLGQVILSREVLGEARWIDIWFQPNPGAGSDRATRAPIDLGLLGTLTQVPALLEPYRNPPSFEAVRSCITKRSAVVAEFLRRSPPPSEADLPQLWILVPTFSDAALTYCGAVPDGALLRGCYRLQPLLGTHIIVLHQLPKTPETLWLRLLGKGGCQRDAIYEVIALPQQAPYRSLALELLSNWKVAVETIGPSSSEEEESFMAFSQAHLEFKAQMLRQGEERGIQIGEQRGIQLGEERAIARQRQQMLELLELELEPKFGEQGLGLLPYLGELTGVTDGYEWLKVLKRETEWEAVRSWWFDRRSALVAEERGTQWLGVALRLCFPSAEGAAIDRAKARLLAPSPVNWEGVAEQLRSADSIENCSPRPQTPDSN